MRLYLGNLPYTVDEAQIRAFIECDVQDIHIPMDKEAGRPRGFAFVEVPDSQGKNAIANKHETYLDGRRIIVNEAQPKSRGGSGGGGRNRPRSETPDRSDKNGGKGRGGGKKGRRGDDDNYGW